ncbi:MAG TPA: mandelate racemase/muconate lactonizing enzyme family protein [Solirubrobacterales bacterium]|jgi:o-succinylbenzoate synthase|nr:mandelate racemase/muconate lactonizing enzyme family protein [Solirubrobacterales bacterium]
MRIASVEVIPYALPFREPYVTAAGQLGRREMVLLRLRDEEGLVGLGEAVPLRLRSGTKLEQVVGQLEMLGEREILGEAELRGGEIDLSPPARCAALTALLDLRGRRAAVEGRAEEEPAGAIRCNATLVAGEPATVAGDAERWAADGFSSFKLKLGAGDDVGQVRAVREALGPEVQIRIDANGAWDAETAKQILAELEPLDLELAEQPVATIEEAAQVAASTSIPLAADESVACRSEAETAAGAAAFALTGIKLSKVGGPEEALEIAEVLPAYVTSALDGPVGIAAAAQVAATLGDLRHGKDTPLAQGLATQRLFASTIATIECELRGDMLYPPTGPGLGVEIDERALDAHRLAL